MHLDDRTAVVVQRDRKDWRTAMVRALDLQEIHWFQPTGAPRPLIHAVVQCTKLLSGELPHECDQSSAPHHLLVCLLKCHTAPAVFEELASLADAGRHAPASAI